MARPQNIVRFKINSFVNVSGTTSWRVSGTKRNGERIRKNFKTKAEALQTRIDLELEEEGHAESRISQRTSLSTNQLSEAEAVFQRIGTRNLTTIVSHYLNLEQRSETKNAKLDQLFAFAEAHYRPETQPITLLNATIEFLNAKKAITDKTRRNYNNSFKYLLAQDPNRHVHHFTVADIEMLLDLHRKQVTRNTHQRLYSSFFNWCVRHHYILENPCNRLDPITSERHAIATLDVAEVRRLLFASIHYQNGVTVAPIAIALFAGLRPSEIEALTPNDIIDGKIRVSGGKLRRKFSRVTPISPNLKTWLEIYPFSGLPNGWDYKLKKLKAATKAQSWKQDVLRHTSITFQCERDKNEPLTAFHCGTSTRMMDLHYRDSAPSDNDLKEFWDLSPQRILSSREEVQLPIRKTVDWPSIDNLRILVWEKPLVHAAKDLGVSNVALKKQCVKLGILLPPRGYCFR